MAQQQHQQKHSGLEKLVGQKRHCCIKLHISLTEMSLRGALFATWQSRL